ncbi:MAG: antitoxin [Caulobacter sp.]|nr:antitoxin [Caulobacter sp.]
MCVEVLKSLGGSVTLVIPEAVLESSGLAAGMAVRLSVTNGRLFVEPSSRPHFDIAELVVRCDPALWVNDEEREWMDLTPTGSEFW